MLYVFVRCIIFCGLSSPVLVQSAPYLDRPCPDFVRVVPNLKAWHCEGAALQSMQALSVKGRTLWGKDVGAEDAKRRVMVLGGIHGAEMSSVSLVFHWLLLAQIRPSDMPQAIA